MSFRPKVPIVQSRFLWLWRPCLQRLLSWWKDKPVDNKGTIECLFYLSTSFEHIFHGCNAMLMLRFFNVYLWPGYCLTLGHLQPSCMTWAGERISKDSSIIPLMGYIINMKWSNFACQPTLWRTGPRFNIKTVFPGMQISNIKIRRSWDRLIFKVQISILVRHLDIEMTPEY